MTSDRSERNDVCGHRLERDSHDAFRSMPPVGIVQYTAPETRSRLFFKVSYVVTAFSMTFLIPVFILSRAATCVHAGATLANPGNLIANLDLRVAVSATGFWLTFALVEDVVTLIERQPNAT